MIEGIALIDMVTLNARLNREIFIGLIEVYPIGWTVLDEGKRGKNIVAFFGCQGRF